MLISEIAADFRHRFGHEPLLVRAPGRINLIGEHTDYNDGLVLPAAIDKEIYFAVGLNGGDKARLVAFDKDDAYEVPVAEVAPSEHLWANYLLGVMAQFQERGVAVPGFDCVFGGNVPIGAGMSSSAAVECGLAFALNELLHTGFDRMALAQMGQQAEHTYAKVMSGLMDQFASLFGRPGHVVRLDCRSLAYEYFPFDASQYHLVLCNSGVKHSLASSEYNKRRQECAQGVAVLQRHYPEIKSLRDATLPNRSAARRAGRRGVPPLPLRGAGKPARAGRLRCPDGQRHGRRGPAHVRLARRPARRLPGELPGVGRAGGNGPPAARRVRGPHDGRGLRRLHHQPGGRRAHRPVCGGDGGGV